MVIKGASVYTERFIFEDRDIVIDRERIARDSKDQEIIDGSGFLAIPGLVDIHFHGAMGHDFCDADYEGLEEIAGFEAEHGVLSICPATMSYDEQRLGRIIDNALLFKGRNTDLSVSDIVGINMEGPFINPLKCGAQNPEYITACDIPMFERLLQRSKGLIKLVDLAPEVGGAMEFIDRFKGETRVSIAHTEADYETAADAFERGADHLTHLYNAMPPMNHRAPGVIPAAREKRAFVELIADGVHVHPAMVRNTFSMFDEDRIVLISDSMEATGLDDGEYMLGGQSVLVEGNRAFLKDKPDTIAGSVTCLYDCMVRAVRSMGIPLEKAVRAATINPAASIGIQNEYGALSEGHYANILLIDSELKIRRIIHRGKEI